MSRPAPARWLRGLASSWRALTREARDTLWLLAMLALVLAPHAPRLPWWASLGAAGALVWRARLAWTDGPLPSRWLLVIMLAASLAMTWLTYRTLVGREPGITLVVILTTLKCLELKARRDSLVCLYLGFFLIFTQFIYSQGLGTAALMLVGVWGLLTALILGQRPLGHPAIKEVGREALRSMVWGLPLMVVLFVLFPRLGPLWSLPTDARNRTGLTDTLTLGEVADLAQDDGIALRVRFTDTVPRPEQMYFRGPTLDVFDGLTWKPAPWRRFDGIPRTTGVMVKYDMTIEPSTLPILPLLEGTFEATLPAQTERHALQRGLEWYSPGKPNQRLVVAGQARLQWTLAAGETPQAMERWVSLPRGFNPRTQSWATELQRRAGQASAPELAQRVLDHIRRENFQYTLSPGLPKDTASPHLIDDFWIDRRVGFCEHFATAFVVVMRGMGVPARVVTGYQGAEFNPVDGQYIVRNSHAHAWAEFWVEGQGWMRVDPTAAVAPERVRQPLRLQPFAGLPGPLGQLDPTALRRLRNLWDAVDHRWNVWVLQYARDQQMDLLKSLGWPQPDWETLAQLLGWALAGLGLGSVLFLWWTRERLLRRPWHKPLLRVHRALQPLAGSPPAGPSPAAASAWHTLLAGQWPVPHSASRQALLRALQELDSLRYGPSPAGPSAHRAITDLVRLVERLARQQTMHHTHDAPATGAHSRT